MGVTLTDAANLLGTLGCFRYGNRPPSLPTLSVSLARLKQHMKGSIYKVLGLLLVAYSLIYGLLTKVPDLPDHRRKHSQSVLSRQHVVCHGGYDGGKFLERHPFPWALKIWPKTGRSISLAEMGMFFSFMGLFTGMVWAKFTWGAWWTNDPKLNGTAITILIYLAYFVLRNSMDDARKKARISAVYNIFAFVMMIVFIGILPRMTDSLHPGNGGNPGFNSYDFR